jgi:DNA-binding CsgD family transcriptional regulator
MSKSPPEYVASVTAPLDTEAPERSAASFRALAGGGDSVVKSLSETLRQLQRVAGYTEGLAMAFDPSVLIPIEFVATFPLEPVSARVACRNEQQEDDVNKFRDLAVAAFPVAALSADHDVECASSPRWQGLLLPGGRRQELRAALVDAHGWCWGAVALYRRNHVRFSRSDLGATADLVPSRASDLARSLVAERAPGSPSEPTLLLMDKSGAVLDAPDRAVRWMDRVRSADRVDRVGMVLASLAARIVRMCDGGEDQRPVRVRMRSGGGIWTTLIAEPLRSESTMALPVVVMATDFGQLFPLQVAAFSLSDREADLVRQVLEGLDTKTIARRMSISGLTVQDHLKSIFQKTGVHSRRELVYRLGGTPMP